MIKIYLVISAHRDDVSNSLGIWTQDELWSGNLFTFLKILMKPEHSLSKPLDIYLQVISLIYNSLLLFPNINLTSLVWRTQGTDVMSAL